jgi:hypothetical protein
MSLNSKGREKRRNRFFIIDNPVYDSDLTSCEFIFYSALVRYAREEEAFIAIRAFAKRWKFSPRTVMAARESLIQRGLIGRSGEKTELGAEVFDILPLPEGSTPVSVGKRLSKEPLPEGSTPVSVGKTNKTESTRAKKNKTPPNGESLTVIHERELDQAIDYIFDKTGVKLKKDKWLKIWWFNAIKLDDLIPLKYAIRNYCESKINQEMGKWDWVNFFRIQAKRASYFPKPEGNRLPFAGRQVLHSEGGHGVSDEEFAAHMAARDAV